MIPGALMLAVLGWMFLSGRTQVGKPDVQQGETEQPDMRVQNLHLIEQTEAGDAWELWAQEAEFYDAKKIVVVHQLRAQLLSQAAHPIHVIADYGQIDSADREYDGPRTRPAPVSGRLYCRNRCTPLAGSQSCLTD